MARMASVSDIKRGKAEKSNSPRDGSELRLIYDQLRAGEEVPIRHWKKTQLIDLYGMVLETVKSGTRGPNGNLAVYRLAGEWDGPYFVPVERLGDGD